MSTPVDPATLEDYLRREVARSMSGIVDDLRHACTRVEGLIADLDRLGDDPRSSYAAIAGRVQQIILNELAGAGIGKLTEDASRADAARTARIGL